MSALCMSADSSSEEIIPFAKMVHEVVSLPVVMRSRNKKGNPIAAAGVIDVISTINLASVFSDYPRIVKRVEEQKIHFRRMKQVL